MYADRGKSSNVKETLRHVRTQLEIAASPALDRQTPPLAADTPSQRLVPLHKLHSAAARAATLVIG